MGAVVGGPPYALLERPVFDADGRLVGRVAAVGSRRGVLRRVGVEGLGPEPGRLRFVGCERLTVERDRIVLSG